MKLYDFILQLLIFYVEAFNKAYIPIFKFIALLGVGTSGLVCLFDIVTFTSTEWKHTFSNWNSIWCETKLKLLKELDNNFGKYIDV